MEGHIYEAELSWWHVGDKLVTRQIEIVGKELLGIIYFNSKWKSPQAEVNYSVLVYILSLIIMLIQEPIKLDKHRNRT
jgi:hypothetical protein